MPLEGVNLQPGEARAMGAIHGRLNQRTVPPVMPSVQKLSDQTKIYLFNVGPWLHRQDMGGVPGSPFFIPPCTEGQKVSKPLVIPGIVQNLYPESERSMKREMEDGFQVALSVVGIGPHMSPSNCLTRYGVFISRYANPDKMICPHCRYEMVNGKEGWRHAQGGGGPEDCSGKEPVNQIEEAWDLLAKGELSTLVNEANSAYSHGPKLFEETVNARHYQAARLLKKSLAECQWMSRQTISLQGKECKFCGEPLRDGFPRCKACNEIVDRKLYEKLQAEG